jgi:hypothetical protein
MPQPMMLMLVDILGGVGSVGGVGDLGTWGLGELYFPFPFPLKPKA